MTKREKEIAACKTYVGINVITINEARKSLGETPIVHPVADRLLHYSGEYGWQYFPDGAPVREDVEKLLPRAFSLLNR